MRSTTLASRPSTIPLVRDPETATTFTSVGTRIAWNEKSISSSCVVARSASARALRTPRSLSAPADNAVSSSTSVVPLASCSGPLRRRFVA